MIDKQSEKGHLEERKVAHCLWLSRHIVAKNQANVPWKRQRDWCTTHGKLQTSQSSSGYFGINSQTHRFYFDYPCSMVMQTEFPPHLTSSGKSSATDSNLTRKRTEARISQGTLEKAFQLCVQSIDGSTLQSICTS